MATPAPLRAPARLPRKEVQMRVKDPAPIRRGRLLKGWTQRQLAVLCNKSQNAVHLLESGKSTTIGEEFALCLFRNLQLGKEFGLKLEDVFEDVPVTAVTDVLNDSCSNQPRESA